MKSPSGTPDYHEMVRGLPDGFGGTHVSSHQSVTNLQGPSKNINLGDASHINCMDVTPA